MNLWYKINRFKRGIHNIIKWFPVIWKDRDWEWEALMKILHFKLKNMEYFFRNHGVSMGSEKRADEMKEVIKLIERILTNDYIQEAFEGNKELLHIDVNTMNRQQRAKVDKLFDEGDKLIQNDVDKVFDLIKINIRKWWD